MKHFPIPPKKTNNKTTTTVRAARRNDHPVITKVIGSSTLPNSLVDTAHLSVLNYPADEDGMITKITLRLGIPLLNNNFLTRYSLYFCLYADVFFLCEIIFFSYCFKNFFF